MAKKYYWLKLKEDFFRDKKIKKLRKIAGGDTYTIIYLKMQLLSLKNDGTLVFEGVEDSFAEEIALEIDEDIDNVKVTIMFLIKNGLLEESEQDHYVMTETIKCIGSESASAERVRKMRARNKLLGIPEIDEKRYGGNGLKVLERDNYKCINCGSTDNICIHHNNGLSNEMKDLITLCRKCHSNIEIKQKSVTCNTPVTTCNTEIEKREKRKELENKSKSKDKEYYSNPDLNSIFLEFLEVRKKLKAVNSERAINTLIKTLSKYPDDIKYQMIENSIVNSWKSVYPLKGNASNTYKREEKVPDWFNEHQEIKKPTKEEQEELDDILNELQDDDFEMQKAELQEKLKNKYKKTTSI